MSVPSGCSRTLSLPELSKVEDLKLLAQKSFAQRFLRLVDVNGRILTDPDEGEHLAAVVQQVTVRYRRSFCCVLW